ncbi:sodium-coupled monocarboxylate transporter 1-like [Brachionus plicatilis]|uniref:Sodium-coupled monocarboxylate transporter 1-like n=1 Tax=Brachionus plicatilis TaxID=10195 RepID=A0A3M7T4C8_BRAPC|nr:sodium-coupled monocarboxylate transporter 1-like [Brachionus plicatilis]
MIESKFNAADYIVFFTVLIISSLIGLQKIINSVFNRFRKVGIENKNECKTNQTSEYLTANKSIGLIPVSFSLFASFFSSTAFLGVTAEVYEYGLIYWTMVFGFVIPPILGAFITAPYFASKNIKSIFEFFEMRYKSKLVRLFTVTCYLLRSIILTAIYIYGPATAFSTITSLHDFFSIALIGTFATIYTTIGGLRAVIFSDMFQAIVMFMGLLCMVVKGLFDLGGFSAMWKINLENQRLHVFDFRLNPLIRQTFWSLFIGHVFHYSMSYCFDQQTIQRFASARTAKIAKIALLSNAPIGFVLISLCCFLGLIVFASLSGCDPLLSRQIASSNQLLTFFIMEKFRNFYGIAGLCLAAIFSSALSSVSSTINTFSMILWEDILKANKHFRNMTDSQSLRVTKIISLSSGLLCTCLAFFFASMGSNLIQISAGGVGAVNGPMIGLFALAFFSYSNQAGSLIGAVFGLIVGLWLNIGVFIERPVYPRLNVSISECSSLASQNYTSGFYGTNGQAVNLYGFSRIYSMSAFWYGPIGLMATFIMGSIMSLALNRFSEIKSGKEVNISLQNIDQTNAFSLQSF